MHIFKRPSDPPILGALTGEPWLGAIVWCGKTVTYRATVPAGSGCHTCEECEKAYDAPIAPAEMSHYLVACAVAKIEAWSGPPHQIRNVIARIATLAIPDAARFLRMLEIERAVDGARC